MRRVLVVRGRRRRASSRGSATSRAAPPSRSASEGAMGTSHADGAPEPAGRGGRSVFEVRIMTWGRQSHRGSYCSLAITPSEFPLVFRHSRSRCVYQTGERRCRTQPVPDSVRVNVVSQDHGKAQQQPVRGARQAGSQRRVEASVLRSWARLPCGLGSQGTALVHIDESGDWQISSGQDAMDPLLCTRDRCYIG